MNEGRVGLLVVRRSAADIVARVVDSHVVNSQSTVHHSLVCASASHRNCKIVSCTLHNLHLCTVHTYSLALIIPHLHLSDSQRSQFCHHGMSSNNNHTMNAVLSIVNTPSCI